MKTQGNLKLERFYFHGDIHEDTGLVYNKLLDEFVDVDTFYSYDFTYRQHEKWRRCHEAILEYDYGHYNRRLKRELRAPNIIEITNKRKKDNPHPCSVCVFSTGCENTFAFGHRNHSLQIPANTMKPECFRFH